jgi:hypothetical protein
MREREREREKKESGEVVRDTTFGEGVRNYISGFEGSQAVPARLSGRGTAYDRNLTDLSLNCPAYNISAGTVQKTQFLCCCLRAVVKLFVSQSLPSIGPTCHNSVVLRSLDYTCMC